MFEWKGRLERLREAADIGSDIKAQLGIRFGRSAQKSYNCELEIRSDELPQENPKCTKLVRCRQRPSAEV